MLKDFTSVLDMHRDARAQVLAALREVYDGRWDRDVESDGGRVLTWQGHLGLLAGCTTAIDSAHAVIATMGTRFLLVRLTGSDTDDLTASALDHVGQETQMRQEIADAFRGLLDHLPGRPRDLGPIRAPLIALAGFVATARSPVDRDYQGEIRSLSTGRRPRGS